MQKSPWYNVTEADQSLIGTKVVKISGKPFKSGEKVGTVDGFIDHPTTGRLCFLMLEDGTHVECSRCKPV